MIRALSLSVVLGAIVVGALWAAQYDSGPIVINQADEYRLVLRFGVPQPELIEPGVAMTDEFFGVALPFRYPFVRLPFADEVLVFDTVNELASMLVDLDSIVEGVCNHFFGRDRRRARVGD